MKIKKRITYDVLGMDFKTIEWICLGLEALKNDEVVPIINMFDEALKEE